MPARAPSVLGLLGILQHYGLTYAMLQTWVQACQRQHTGQVTFELTQGRLRTVKAVAASTRRPHLARDD